MGTIWLTRDKVLLVSDPDAYDVRGTGVVVATGEAHVDAHDDVRVDAAGSGVTVVARDRSRVWVSDGARVYVSSPDAYACVGLGGIAVITHDDSGRNVYGRTDSWSIAQLGTGPDTRPARP